MLVAPHDSFGKLGVEVQDRCALVLGPLRMNLSEEPYIAILSTDQFLMLLRHQLIFNIPSSNSHGAFHSIRVLPNSGFTLLTCNIATEEQFGHVELSSHHSIESASAKIFHKSDCIDLRCHRRVNVSSRDWR